MTIKDLYPIIRIEDCLKSIGKLKIFSKLDAISAYFQIEIDYFGKDKTITASDHGWHRLFPTPSCPKSAMSSFQAALDIVLSASKVQCALLYLHYAVLFSSSVEEHVDHIWTDLGLL